mgnify:CR=1 FL=1
MRRFRIRSLSKQQQRDLQTDSGTVAEELVAEVYGLLHRPDRAVWYDCVLKSTGAKTEVKSCWAVVGQQYPARGRFRIRRDQLRSLLASDASGVAWVAFVLFDADAGEVLIRRAKPSTVARLVRERGGWNEAGHAEFDYQHKLPYDAIF